MPMQPGPWSPEDPDEVEIERSRLAEIRARLPEAARPLDRVPPRLVALTVVESAFTSFTYSLALAYSEVEALTLTETRHRADDIARIQDGMTASLTTWRHAEHASSLTWS
ncbi:hypothetical protein [Nonomuraea sp. NPDC002799]